MLVPVFPVRKSYGCCWRYALALSLFVPPVYTAIAFSLPVSDVAGLVQIPAETKAE